MTQFASAEIVQSANSQKNFSLYIHFPYCEKKCPYCDFNSYALTRPFSEESFLQNYHQELAFLKADTDYYGLESIFFGGGTPSLMPARLVHNLLNTIQKLWHLPTSAEITLEANPSSVEMQKLQDFAHAGVNRLSLGVQSFRDEKLKFLGRTHNANQAKYAIDAMMKIFDRHNFDLISATPDEKLDDWRGELETALSFNPTHLSCYQLTIEPDTHFFKLAERGALILPDTADFMRETISFLGAHDLPLYEISNYGQEKYHSRHNLAYWQGRDYAAIGPGGHSRIQLDDGFYARENIKNPDLWQQKIQDGFAPIANQEKLTPTVRAVENIIMGLRLKTGIAITQAQFDTLIDKEKLESHKNLICAEKIDDKTIILRLTDAGIFFLDYLLTEIIKNSIIY